MSNKLLKIINFDTKKSTPDTETDIKNSNHSIAISANVNMLRPPTFYMLMWSLAFET